ncbi:hypothetical protein NC99_29350 [Sunxiuqinia dokdonensis]|uniref:Cytochrome c domain-containing protein n=2 Tax=Sunxiuqinia dokdonensis TaxID=1409788 RepID=A0A0L8V746_9BACT|nr:hypothetical protein NC99_29350 [Sunxiuqinia dokdonensis]
MNIVLIFALFSCKNNDKNKPDGADGWLKGNDHEKFETVSKHLRGFDLAMVETGYRYQELYWAGKDQNWEYAAYQVEKLRVAVKNGLERRPKRAKSAQNFLNIALPQMDSAVASRDTVTFNQAFSVLTSHCMACHALEEVPHFTVKEPTARQSPIRK